jgi:dethiobiotin synthetase
MTRGFFVTGTDTGVGKTTITLGLMQALQARGQVVTAMKPVASGCVRTASGLISDDARRLQARSSIALTYDQVNPYAFEPPIAPHLAAEAVGVGINIQVIEQALGCLATGADQVLVEGVGGWLVPISQRQTMADVALALGLPVIMVVGVTLGCINHALLTAGAVQCSGLRLVGWIANRVDPECQKPDAIIAALEGWLAVPLLGDVRYQSDDALRATQAQQVDIAPLLASLVNSSS